MIGIIFNIAVWILLGLWLLVQIPIQLIDVLYQSVTGRPSFLGASPIEEDKGYSQERKNQC